MNRELLSIATTARTLLGRKLAGPCPHCEARNRRATDLAAREAQRDPFEIAQDAHDQIAEANETLDRVAATITRDLLASTGAR